MLEREIPDLLPNRNDNNEALIPGSNDRVLPERTALSVTDLYLFSSHAGDVQGDGIDGDLIFRGALATNPNEFFNSISSASSEHSIHSEESTPPYLQFPLPR